MLIKLLNRTKSLSIATALILAIVSCTPPNLNNAQKYADACTLDNNNNTLRDIERCIRDKFFQENGADLGSDFASIVSSYFDQRENLADQRDRELLTAEEYDLQKAQLEQNFQGQLGAVSDDMSSTALKTLVGIALVVLVVAAASQGGGGESNYYQQNNQGCCSHHGGLAGFCYAGRQVCNDQSLSPTCTC